MCQVCIQRSHWRFLELIALERKPDTLLEPFPIPVRNRQSSVATEGSGGDFHPWRGLAALVLADVHEAHDALDRLAVESHCQHLLEAAILLNISFENGIKYLVWGQVVNILLARAQFGGGWLLDH